MAFFALDALVDLLPVNSHILGSVDSNADLVALDAQYGHRNFVADHHGLADTPSQYQHNRAPASLALQRPQLPPLIPHRHQPIVRNPTIPRIQETSSQLFILLS